MKLTYVANIRIPTEKAHGIQVIKMCEAFADVGLDVELIVPRRIQSNPDLKEKDIFHYYQVKRNFQVKKVSTIDLLPLERYWSKIGGIAFAIQEISFSILSLFSDSLIKADLIYTRSKILNLLASQFTNVDIVYEAHKRGKNKWLDKTIAKRAKAIVTITKSIQKTWKQLGAKTIYAPDGVSNEFFISSSRNSARKILKLPQNKSLIGYIGNLVTLEKEKGIKTLLQAIQKIENQEEIVCCIAGGPEKWKEKYQYFTNQLSIKDKVIFAGHVDFKKVPTYLKAMDVLIIPFPNQPHFAYNASPLKLFEYMATGRPIVASDLPSIREILDENTAYFAEPDDPQSLAKTISKALKDSQNSKKIARMAREKARHYTWSKRVEKILAAVLVSK
jgi:glycosyltransferase involved in cell wall biosynthesis